jgi:flagellar biosynthetic protein FliR
MIALSMTAGLYGLLSVNVAGIEALPHTIVSELVTGLSIGLLVRFIILAVTMAGSFASLQIGLSSALVSDPALGGQVPLLSRLLGLLAVLVLFSMNIHHLWFSAIVRSYQVFPVGGVFPAETFAGLAVAAAGEGMALAISLAAPLLIYGVVFNVALGLAARLAPGIQVYFIAQPLNLLIGIAVLMATIGSIMTVFTTSLERWLTLMWR